jgi:hypothetical protein
VTIQQYNATVVEERKALAKLQRLLREHGSPSSRLEALDTAFAKWRALAAILEAAGAE